MNKISMLFSNGRWTLISWILLILLFTPAFLCLNSGRKITFLYYGFFAPLTIATYLILLFFILSIFVGYFKSFQTTDFLPKDYVYHIFKLTISLVINFFYAFLTVYFTEIYDFFIGTYIAVYFLILFLLLMMIYICKGYTVLRLVWFGNNAGIFAFLICFLMLMSDSLH